MPLIFDSANDFRSPAINSGTVVASYSKSKGFFFLCRSDDRLEADDSPRNWSLCAEILSPTSAPALGASEHLRTPLDPHVILAESRLSNPYFLCWYLEYDANAKKSFYHDKQPWNSHALSLRHLLTKGVQGVGPDSLKPGHYLQVTIESDAPKWVPLYSRKMPTLAQLRPSEALALLLFLYGPMDLNKAARGLTIPVASVKSAAGALTKKGAINPVGKGIMVTPVSAPALVEILWGTAQREPWLLALIENDDARQAFKARAFRANPS